MKKLKKIPVAGPLSRLINKMITTINELIDNVNLVDNKETIIVKTLPSIEDAKPNTNYLVPMDATNGIYKSYQLIVEDNQKKFVQIDKNELNFSYIYTNELIIGDVSLNASQLAKLKALVSEN